ncbi:hypothetical protein BDQ17DRAFT_1272573 [Cyathus striatus]|nr:hypothetical protein BDQ17DRAFT_1272573 [Cyathus striatus]
MPRPQPLTNLSSAHAYPLGDHLQNLTPRTPHSRAGRAEEGFTEIELLQEYDDDEHQSERQQQAAPLLASTSSGYRAGKKKISTNPPSFSLFVILSRLPLALGISVAGFLLFLIVLSLKRPEALHEYLGTSNPIPEVAENSIPPLTISQQATPTGATPASPSHLHEVSDAHVISYENYTAFPLHASDYLRECHKINKGFMSHGNYWDLHPMGPIDVVHHDDIQNYKLPEGERTAVCTSTITYMLDGTVGLVADIALMAQAAAMARERNRTFLVDDTFWNRGKWSDYFQDVRARQPGPEPGCRAPPPEELVSCPRTARHWVINSRTAKFHFGHAFSENYEDPYAHQLNRLKPVFTAALESLSTTIRPNANTAHLIRLAREELTKLKGKYKEYVAIHIRRGDRKASSFRYHGAYVPVDEFVEATTATTTRLQMNSNTAIIYVASDSPEAYGRFKNQYNGPIYSLFESEDGRLNTLASNSDYYQKEFGHLSSKIRFRTTQGMVVDLALISGLWTWNEDPVPSATICTLSSNVCRIAAVGLGWTRAFGDVDQMGTIDTEHKRWVEIDEAGRIVPVWQAFELF